VQAVEKEIVSEAKNKPFRDEQTLAKVLEAAYVMQERNRQLRKAEPGPKLTKDLLAAEERPISSPGVPHPQESPPPPKADSTLTLAQIVEIQHQVQVRHLELENVMSLVAERLTQIAGARSAAIGILDGKKVRYQAAAGVMALPAGTEVPVEKALSVDCLRTGHVFRCADVNSELPLDRDECRRRGIQSMIAVPVFHDGGVAGSLELYFPNPQAFTEEEVHTCQLMAGLVTEALARNEEVSWKKSLATERAVMLEALEKLKPNLAALADTPAAKGSAAISSPPSSARSASTFVCRKCGHELVGQEQFCGNCGLPRSSDYEAPNLQSTIATLWHMQEAMNKIPYAHPANGAVVHEESQANLDQVPAAESLADSIAEQVPEALATTEPFATAEYLPDETTKSTELREAPERVDFENSARADLEIPLHAIPEDDDVETQEDEVEAPEPTALAKPERTAAWSSAATARDFLEQLAAAKDPSAWAQFWNTRRGDIYLAVAVVLVLGVIRWGILSSHSVSATGSPTVSTAHRRAAPDADLSLFDRILVKLGLAEAPEPLEYKGNPGTQVWVDLHTALYYCPGADLYGKTPKGKFSSQRDARLDQFEPAYRKACD
jgi:putative methionine-R-sulfoxide reductase with GAF domain